MKKTLTTIFILSLILLAACSLKETTKQKTEESVTKIVKEKTTPVKTTPVETAPAEPAKVEPKIEEPAKNTTPKEVTGSASAKINKQHNIKITKEEFNPETLTIKTGDTVTFENTRTGRGVTKAIITANKYPCKGVLPVTTIESGKTYSVTFKEAMKCIIVESVYDQSIKPLEITIQ